MLSQRFRISQPQQFVSGAPVFCTLVVRPAQPCLLPVHTKCSSCRVLATEHSHFSTILPWDGGKAGLLSQRFRISQPQRFVSGAPVFCTLVVRPAQPCLLPVHTKRSVCRVLATEQLSTFQLSYLGMGEKRVCLVSDLGLVNLSNLYQVPLFFARLSCVLPNPASYLYIQNAQFAASSPLSNYPLFNCPTLGWEKSGFA